MSNLPGPLVAPARDNHPNRLYPLSRAFRRFARVPVNLVPDNTFRGFVEIGVQRGL